MFCVLFTLILIQICFYLNMNFGSYCLGLPNMICMITYMLPYMESYQEDKW